MLLWLELYNYMSIKNQKFHITTSEDEKKATLVAKLLEEKTIQIIYMDLEGRKDSIGPITIPKFTDYKQDLDNVKTILNIKELK